MKNTVIMAIACSLFSATVPGPAQAKYVGVSCSRYFNDGAGQYCSECYGPFSEGQCTNFFSTVSYGGASYNCYGAYNPPNDNNNGGLSAGSCTICTKPTPSGGTGGIAACTSAFQSSLN